MVRTAGSVERRIDLGLALALPSLVVVSCLAPLLGLVLGSAGSWLAPALVFAAAVGVCTYLLRRRGVGRAFMTAALSVAAGSALLAAVTWGLNTLGGSASQSVNDIANTLTNLIPLLLALLGVVAIVVTFRAVPGRRGVLAVAWLIAVATPFVLAIPVGNLSSLAGNAGMDVVGLFVMPLAAFFAWPFLFLGSSASSEVPVAASDA
jgi:hypothetical protein